MTTLILPGFSRSNKDWAEDVAQQLDHQFPTEVINWQHWQSGSTLPGWIEKEAVKISAKINKKTNIIAKSIGTLVAMQVLKIKPDLVNKLILCGIPVKDLSVDDLKNYVFLKDFPNQNVICIQNEHDHHGSLQEVKDLIGAINRDITVVSKPRSDHDYPYSYDFIEFL